MQKINNGLVLKKTKTRSEPVGPITDVSGSIRSFINRDAIAVAYLDNEILVGEFKSGNLHFVDNRMPGPSFIQRFRVFNEDCELLMWRSGGVVMGRFRTDLEGEESYFVEASQVLFGTRVDEKVDKEGFVQLREDRGTGILLPARCVVGIISETSRLAVRTRNYVSYTECWQAAYTDARFVGFVPSGEAK